MSIRFIAILLALSLSSVVFAENTSTSKIASTQVAPTNLDLEIATYQVAFELETTNAKLEAARGSLARLQDALKPLYTEKASFNRRSIALLKEELEAVRALNNNPYERYKLNAIEFAKPVIPLFILGWVSGVFASAF